MNEVIKFIEKPNFNNFDHIKISIANPENMISWSHGEIKKPETINYRTFKLKKRTFALEFLDRKDYECICGKYKRMKFRCYM